MIDWNEVKEVITYLKNYGITVKIEIENNSIAWAGFWIGLGIVLAVGVSKGQVILK